MTADPSRAFNAAFRAKLADAVTVAINRRNRIVRPWPEPWPAPPSNYKLGLCDCPEGCLITGQRYPKSSTMVAVYGFTRRKHESFQDAFDYDYSDGTHEAALGLLYRKAWQQGWIPKGRYQQ